MRKPTLKQAINRLIEELNNDPEYRYGWQANIAMAYLDQARMNVSDELCHDGHGNQTYAEQVLHNMANKAAAAFLDQLTGKNMGDLPGMASIAALHHQAKPIKPAQ